MLQNIVSARERIVGGAPQLRPGHPAYPWWVMAAISFAMIMSVLDSTIVNVAIAKLQVAFGESTDAVQWVITAYLLAFAVMLAASGWLADRFGYKTVFLAAVSLFTFGSFLCSASWSLSTLILARIVQGIGGGMIGPVSMAIMLREFPKEKLGMAMGFFMIPALASSSFGPTLGGWLIDNFSWQMMFDVNVPIGIVGLFASYVILRDHRAEGKHPFDFAGFAAVAVALGSLLLALADGNAEWNTDGWGSTFIVSCFAISAFGFLLFFIIELTTDHPLLDFSLFRDYNFSLSSVILFIFGLGIFGSDFLLPLYLQVGLGYTPTQAGMVFLPFGFVMIITAIIGGRLTDRIGAKIPGVVGILLRAYGMYRFTFLSAYSSNSQVVTTVLFLAAGMGFLMSPLQTTAIASISGAKAAQAGGLMQIIRQLGGSFGVAILSTILIHREKFHLDVAGQAMSSWSPAFRDVLSRAYFIVMNASGGTPSAAMSKGQSIIMAAVQKQSFVSAIDDVFFVALLVSIVSSIPFLFLKTKRRGKGGRLPAATPARKHEGMNRQL